MTKKQKEKYCYLTPDFPKKAFMIVVFFSSTEIPLMSMPLTNIIENTNEADQLITDFINELAATENNNKIEVIDYAMLIPITLIKLFPLKKEYWTDCKKDPKYDDKLYIYVSVVANLPLHKILVTPFGFVEKKKHWEFCIAYPFSIFAEDDEVEKFIYGSDQVVDIKAKYAAFYIFGEAKRYNWKTGEISEIEKEVPKRSKIIN